MIYDDNNIFAKILRGEIPCNKIFEDDKVTVKELGGWECAKCHY